MQKDGTNQDRQVSGIEHLHIPIPQVIRGNMQGNIGIVPQTNKCCICGEIMADHPDTEARWLAFLLREKRYEDLDKPR